ncbi:hypothetical protein LPJ55_003199 [Coemansia sp. RSA 990]|nr:hypothetical protein LPJ55_003199 [Coemansia sp. RSA 990]KAJ2675107.1 hypothetical protein IWW42_001253 [Coemansia sp. RSA 1085]
MDSSRFPKPGEHIPLQPSSSGAAYMHTPQQPIQPQSSTSLPPAIRPQSVLSSGVTSSGTNAFTIAHRNHNPYSNAFPPLRQIQPHHPYQQPVKLLQSCDSCRRRKIRCSGEKPTCSSCIRYQEHCHYSPLATPRRRGGKRARNGNDRLVQPAGHEGSGSSSRGDSEPPHPGAGQPAGASNGGMEQWQSEAQAMRNDIRQLASKLDMLVSKLDMLGGQMARQDRSSEPSRSDGAGDRAERFGAEIGMLSDIMGGVGAEPHAEAGQPAGTVEQLESEEMQEHLIETFYENADVHTIASIPRYVFRRLYRENRVPRAMINVMKADACNYTSNKVVMSAGRAWARGFFIERAYGGLFECLAYDSAEHCVALLLFAMVLCTAGLHRTWIMTSLSTQMAIRLRFSTLDSPLSAPAFSGDSQLGLEWKRRVFWQLCTFDVLTSTLSDLPPTLHLDDVRCNSPHAQTGHIAALGPSVVLCDDAQTTEAQIELLRIMSDVGAAQSRLDPEATLFPASFAALRNRIEDWQQQHMPDKDVFTNGSPAQVAQTFAARPGLVFLGLLCQYTWILLCMIKDEWLPINRTLTPEETTTLAWARKAADTAAQTVHRLVPLVRGMRLSAVCPFVSCVVYQACVCSLHACHWRCGPHRMLAAVNAVQDGLSFLDFVAPRWGFAAVLTTSLRSLVVERGFGPENAAVDEEAGDSQFHSAAVSGELPSEEQLRPFVRESQWERVLRSGEIPAELCDNDAYSSGPSPQLGENAPMGDDPGLWPFLQRTRSQAKSSKH